MLITRLERVSFNYGTRQILNEVFLSLNEGEKIGLIGPNGGGKSSLLKILAGIERPAKGERILRNGTIVAYLPQEYAGEDEHTALEEVLNGSPKLLALEKQ